MQEGSEPSPVGICCKNMTKSWNSSSCAEGNSRQRARPSVSSENQQHCECNDGEIKAATNDLELLAPPHDECRADVRVEVLEAVSALFAQVGVPHSHGQRQAQLAHQQAVHPARNRRQQRE